MNACALLDDLKGQGLRLLACGDVLIVDAPRNTVTADLLDRIAANKPDLLTLLAEPVATGARSRLAEYAADRTPSVRLTIRETGDTERDFDLVHRVRLEIAGYEPGGNHIYLAIITFDKRRVVVEWRAVAARELRMALAHVLARAAVSERTT